MTNTKYRYLTDSEKAEAEAILDSLRARIDSFDPTCLNILRSASTRINNRVAYFLERA